MANGAGPQTGVATGAPAATDLSRARDLLGISAHASPAVVNAAFRARVREVHPDAGGTGGDAAALVAARKLCVDAALREGTAPTRAGAPLGGTWPPRRRARVTSAEGFVPLFADPAATTVDVEL